jgi:hypothetical protein
MVEILPILTVGGTQLVVAVQLLLEETQDQDVQQKVAAMAVLVLQQQFQIPQLLMEVVVEVVVMVGLQLLDKVEQVVVEMEQERVLLQDLLRDKMEQPILEAAVAVEILEAVILVEVLLADLVL